jgi:hypothetical protein
MAGVCLGTLQRIRRIWVRARCGDSLRVSAVVMAWIMFKIMIKARFRVRGRVVSLVAGLGKQSLCFRVVLVMFKTKASVSTGLWFMVRVLLRVWALVRVKFWFRIKNGLWLGAWLG